MGGEIRKWYKWGRRDAYLQWQEIYIQWTNPELKILWNSRGKNFGLLIIIAGGIQISRPKWIQTQEKLKLQTEKVSEIIYDDLYLWF